MNHDRLFFMALRRGNRSRPPVWMMRQAGRYHSHYRELRKRYSFMEICKIPTIACEAALGPVDEFGFDAAILFSDLLFPLEALGMPLSYEPGPRLGWYLRDRENLRKLEGGSALIDRLSFQSRALELTRRGLPSDKGLIGFVGGPLTLYCYAVEGSHQGGFESARLGFEDGRFNGFVERLVDLLAQNMALQARSGADVIAMLDTCAGEFDPVQYREIVVPVTRCVLEKFQSFCPGFPVIYYSKGTDSRYWDALRGLPITGIGIDWRSEMPQVLSVFGDEWAIQGNVDPQWLCLSEKDLELRLRDYFSRMKSVPVDRLRGWICGLGHGILQHTPESNVHLFMRLQREYFSCERGNDG